MSEKSHDHPGAARVVRAIVVTVSDTRGSKEDVSGAIARERLEAVGVTIVRNEYVRDEREEIAALVRAISANEECDVLVLTGGTGIAPRDVTYEAVAPLLDKVLDGFGEAFRRLSWDEVGARSVLSRAVAGTRGRTLVAALPGSTNAVKLAVDRVLAPIVGHAVKLLRG